MKRFTSWLMVGIALGIVGMFGVLQLWGYEEEVDLRKKTVGEVMQEYEKEWRANPDVQGVAPGDNDIWIITDRPDLFPAEIDGVPIIIKEPPHRLPPPPGVHVVQPDGTWEHWPEIETCPEGTVDEWEYQWHFCNNPENLQPTPSYLMAPPIAGVPFQRAQEIVEKYSPEIMKMEGVQGVSLGGNGMEVITNHPELLPSDYEGLKVITKPVPENWHVGSTNHTSAVAIRPLQPGVAMEDNSPGGANLYNFFTGVTVLSEGKPWVLIPNHAVARCDQTPYCPANSSTLNACPHYEQPDGLTPRIDQPTDFNNQRVSWLTRWQQLFAGNGYGIDSAAGFMDSNTTEGDASLVMTRGYYQFAGTYTGTISDSVLVNDIVYIPTAVDFWENDKPPHNQYTVHHQLRAQVTNTNTSRVVFRGCIGVLGANVTSTGLIQYTALDGDVFLPGSSGALVMKASNSNVLALQVRTTLSITSPRRLGMGIEPRRQRPLWALTPSTALPLMTIRWAHS